MAVQSKQVPRAEARVGPADAKAYEVHAGEYVQIEDIQGCQVSDFLAFHRDRPGVGISTTVTRALVDGLFPLPKIGPDGRMIEVEPAPSKAGDYVLMRAERDLVVASSACPDDLGPTNGGNPTDIMVRVFGA